MHNFGTFIYTAATLNLEAGPQAATLTTNGFRKKIYVSISSEKQGLRRHYELPQGQTRIKRFNLIREAGPQAPQMVERMQQELTEFQSHPRSRASGALGSSLRLLPFLLVSISSEKPDL